MWIRGKPGKETRRRRVDNEIRGKKRKKKRKEKEEENYQNTI